MNRFIWSVGVTGLALAGLTSVLLRRPVEPSFTQAATAPAPRRSEAGPPLRPMHAAEPTESPDADPPSTLAASGMAEPRVPSTPVRARRPTSESRLRLVQALRGAPSEPGARREAVLASLVASGESQAPWTHQAREALDLWRQQVTTSVLPVQAQAARCFVAGCVTRVTFPDAASFDVAIGLTPELRLPGGSAHLQLPAEHLASGEVSAAWVVLPPDAP